MNRREFTATLGAAFAAPALPFAAPTAATTPVAAPPATYLWADLIARSRGSLDAGFLARRLGLSPAVAEHIMDKLLRDGVIHAPGVGGLAQAANPIRLDAPTPTVPSRLAETAKQQLRAALEDTPQDMPDHMDASADPQPKG